jgi:hypothetical protein
MNLESRLVHGIGRVKGNSYQIVHYRQQADKAFPRLKQSKEQGKRVSARPIASICPGDAGPMHNSWRVIEQRKKAKLRSDLRIWRRRK